MERVDLSGSWTQEKGTVVTFREEAGPILNGLPSSLTDIDPEETSEWLDSLDQLIDEARGRIAADSRHSLLTPAGRAALASFLDGKGLVMVEVERAADIIQLLRWSKRRNVRVAISGGAEAWQVAPALAAAKVPAKAMARARCVEPEFMMDFR